MESFLEWSWDWLEVRRPKKNESQSRINNDDKIEDLLLWRVFFIIHF